MIDPVQRAQRWSAFYQEEHGLKDMLEAMRMQYFVDMGKLQPHQTKELAALSMAGKIVSEMDNYIRLIIAEGDNEKLRIEHADKVAKWDIEHPGLSRFNPFR